ncbi:MAG TPA: hypothetical protein VKH42_16880 [Vicinamibacterales bacterium]|nr:hypothetical protein [Vicinamibacterales bacterium]
MEPRQLGLALATAASIACAIAVRASAQSAPSDDVALLRVFLTDGRSLVSFGEPARVGGRIVFSMPSSAVPGGPLELVNLSADRVDWIRTDRYAETIRARRYMETQAENDYTQLSNEVAQALNDVAVSHDPARRLAVVETARRKLADWPARHYHYREGEVLQMLGLLDEAIADLRASTGTPGRYALSLSAFAAPPATFEPLLPRPSLQEAIEQVLTAASLVENSVERVSLLGAAAAAIDRDRAGLPGDWADETRSEVDAAIKYERHIDESYRTLTTRVVAQADRRARVLDVRGLERLLQTVELRDAALGGRRPEAVSAIVGAVQEKLDAVRRQHLARERWALREPVFARYGIAIRAPIDLFGALRPALEDIRALSGSTPASLMSIERTTKRIQELVAAIVPPEELAAAHALLVSATQLAASATDIRRQAALAGDMTRAWDASSAAAGALMLGTKARADIQTLLRPPRFP